MLARTCSSVFKDRSRFRSAVPFVSEVAVSTDHFRGRQRFSLGRSFSSSQHAENTMCGDNGVVQFRPETPSLDAGATR